MPNLPSPEIGDYQSQVDLSEPFRKITPEARVGTAGSAIENVGNQWAQAVDTKNRADGAVYAANQMADFRTRQAALVDQAKQTAAPDGSGFTQGVLDQYDKDSAKLLGEAKNNQYATFALQNHLRDFRNQIADHSINWEAQTGVAFRGNSIQQNINKLSPLVEADPSQWKSAGAEQMNAINNSNLPPEQRIQLGRKLDETLSVAAANGLARQDPVGVITGLNDPSKAHPSIAGLSDQQREQLRAKANDNLSKPVYDALTDGNTSQAQQQLNSVRDIIDPKNAYVLQNSIDARVKEKQNDQKQDIADRFQDSMTAAQYGLKTPVSVTRSEMDVLYPKDGKRHWDALQGVVAAGAKAKEYDQMTPEQINADVNAAQPEHGGPEVANQLKAFEIRANAADRSIKARKEDPAQFAIDSGAGWKPLDFSNTDDMMANLRSRANTQGTVAQQTGVNTPLLSKQEQKQFVAGLASQNPKDLVQTLTTLRATMPTDQSYTSLLKQVAPDSPLTAAAGAMLDRPAQGAVPNWYNPSFATNPVVPQRILEGKDILESKDEKGIASKFPMPGDKDLMPQFMAAIGGSNSDLFRGRDKTLETTYASFKAYYAAEASHRGVTNGIINTDIARVAAEGVTNGGATQYGRSELVVPAGMDPSRFEGNMDAAQTQALHAAGYSESDIDALHIDGIREQGDMLGTGQYVILNGNGDALKSKDGKKAVIIDLNQALRIPSALPGGLGSPRATPDDKIPTPGMVAG